MFIAENSSSEILKILLPNVKITVTEFMNFQMKKLTFQSFKIFGEKRNSYRFYSYQNHLSKTVEEINREAENDKIKFH